jgi:hypothetical protein
MIDRQPDLEIVVPPSDAPLRLPAALEYVDADVVIVGLPAIDTAAVRDPMLFANPRLRILGIALDGRDAVLYELAPHRVALGGVSEHQLLSAIRTDTRFVTG